jgi:hypothetical protein
MRIWQLHGCLFLKLPPRAIGNRQAAGALFVALRNKYTPANMFRLNQNIKPTNSASGYDRNQPPGGPPPCRCAGLLTPKGALLTVDRWFICEHVLC